MSQFVFLEREWTTAADPMFMPRAEEWENLHTLPNTLTELLELPKGESLPSPLMLSVGGTGGR